MINYSHQFSFGVRKDEYKVNENSQKEARKFFHGDIMGAKSICNRLRNYFHLTDLATGTMEKLLVCRFCIYCVIKAGYDLPVKYPSEAVSCNFAG